MLEQLELFRLDVVICAAVELQLELFSDDVVFCTFVLEQQLEELSHSELEHEDVVFSRLVELQELFTLEVLPCC